MLQSRRFASPRSTLHETYVFCTTLQICYVFYTTLHICHLFYTTLHNLCVLCTTLQTLFVFFATLQICCVIYTTLQFPIFSLQPFQITGFLLYQLQLQHQTGSTNMGKELELITMQLFNQRISDTLVLYNK